MAGHSGTDGLQAVPSPSLADLSLLGCLALKGSVLLCVQLEKADPWPQISRALVRESKVALRIATLQGPVIIAVVNAPCISGQRKQLSESEGIAKNCVHSHMYDYSLGLNDASVSTVMSSLVLVVYTSNPRPGEVEVGDLFTDQTG